jgi:hypothetical protein
MLTCIAFGIEGVINGNRTDSGLYHKQNCGAITTIVIIPFSLELFYNQYSAQTSEARSNEEVIV